MIEQITPWAFLGTDAGVRVKRFDGRPVVFCGVRFEGSPEHLFWSRYIEPFLEDLCLREIGESMRLAKEREIDGPALLKEVQELFDHAFCRIYSRMSEIDQRLRGQGFPERVPRRNIARNIEVMNEFVAGFVDSELAMWRPSRQVGHSQTRRRRSTMRDDFPAEVKRIVATRVAHRCSFPGCRTVTAGPQSDSTKALNLGVAAQITAAASGGPRYDAEMATESRCSIENAIWLCQTHAKLVDNDPTRYTADNLRDWKRDAEADALAAVERGSRSDPERLALLDARFRMVIDDYEIRGTPQSMIDSFNDLTIEERADLFDRAVKLKKGKPPKHNPYRGPT